MTNDIENICAAAILCYREGVSADNILKAVEDKLASGVSLTIKDAMKGSDVLDWLYATLAKIAGVDIQLIKSEIRSRPLPQLRYMLYGVMYDLGYSVTNIARLTDTDHSTVSHGISQSRLYGGSGYRKEGVIYNDFRKTITPCFPALKSN